MIECHRRSKEVNTFQSKLSRMRLDVALIILVCMVFAISAWLPNVVPNSLLRCFVTVLMCLLALAYCFSFRFRVFLQRNTYQRSENIESVDLFFSQYESIRQNCCQEIRIQTANYLFESIRKDKRKPDVLTDGHVEIGLVPVVAIDRNEIAVLGWGVAYLKDHNWHATSIFLIGPKEDALNHFALRDHN